MSEAAFYIETAITLQSPVRYKNIKTIAVYIFCTSKNQQSCSLNYINILLRIKTLEIFDLITKIFNLLRRTNWKH